MILGMEIGLAIFGLIAMVKGKMTVSKNKVVVGAPARLLGLLALTPLPAALLFVLLYVASQGGQINDDDKWTVTGIEAGTVILIAILVFVLAAAVGITPKEAEQRERRASGRYDYEDEEDELDDRPRKRRDRDDEEDEDRPRKRRERDRDDDDEEDDRPRKRGWER
jgi:hypothetical protein